MNWITGVKYNPNNTAIAEVEVRSDIGGTMGTPARQARSTVITAIDGGSAYTTAVVQEGRWVRGEDVRVVTVGYERFIRSDRNAVKGDNLGALPRVA